MLLPIGLFFDKFNGSSEISSIGVTIGATGESICGFGGAGECRVFMTRGNGASCGGVTCNGIAVTICGATGSGGTMLGVELMVCFEDRVSTDRGAVFGVAFLDADT